MSGPDGLEQRTADLEETFDLHYEHIDRLEQFEEESVDEALMELAEDRLDSFAVAL